jgi:hypothetical protein
MSSVDLEADLTGALIRKPVRFIAVLT